MREQASRPKGSASASLGTRLAKIVRRAGLTPWSKGFHNMRASCETDLMQNHPIHVVTVWIGNTPKIALTHYLQTNDSDFSKALGVAGQRIGRPIRTHIDCFTHDGGVDWSIVEVDQHETIQRQPRGCHAIVQIQKSH